MSSIFECDRLMTPPSSPGINDIADHQTHPLGDQRALEKLAMELSMLDIANGAIGDAMNADLASALMSVQQQQQQQQHQQQQQQQHSPNCDGIVPGSTLNAFTSMLGFNGNANGHFDDRKKSQNMTECVPVPSSEHVAEIVGRQGKFSILTSVVLQSHVLACAKGSNKIHGGCFRFT